MAETKSRIDPEVLDELLREVDNEHDLTGVLRQLSKQLVERALGVMLREVSEDKGLLRLERSCVTHHQPGESGS